MRRAVCTARRHTCAILSMFQRCIAADLDCGVSWRGARLTNAAHTEHDHDDDDSDADEHSAGQHGEQQDEAQRGVARNRRGERPEIGGEPIFHRLQRVDPFRRGAEPVRSPERQRLAERIAAHAEAVQRTERVGEAWRRVDDQLTQLRSAVRAAEEALADARANAPQQLVEQVLGEAADDGPTVAQAEAQLRDARARLAEARRTRALLSTEATKADIAERISRKSLDFCMLRMARQSGSSVHFRSLDLASKGPANGCCKILADRAKTRMQHQST